MANRVVAILLVGLFIQLGEPAYVAYNLHFPQHFTKSLDGIGRVVVGWKLRF